MFIKLPNKLTIEHYSGYNVYFDYEKEHLVFTGWKDELIEEIKNE